MKGNGSSDSQGCEPCCPGDLDICCEGSDGGTLLPFIDGEQSWPKGLRAILYLLGMVWCFLGVAIVADLFMGAIDEITTKIYVKVDKTGKRRIVRFWNPTVANLSLMALGSSAPEIMLNVMEVVLGDFYTGPLGPSTIVGSAAFNLLVIIAVCVMAIDQGTKRIKQLKVYAITATTSILAYIWLLVILIFSSRDIVTLWEALLTFVFFWILLVAAFAADKNFFRSDASVSPDDGAHTTVGAPAQAEIVHGTSAGAGGAHNGADEEKRKKISMAVDTGVGMMASMKGKTAAVAPKSHGDDATTTTNGTKPATNEQKDKMADVAHQKGLDGLDESEKLGIVIEAMGNMVATGATHTRNAMAWLTGKKAKPVLKALNDVNRQIIQKARTMSLGVVAEDEEMDLAIVKFQEEAVDVMEDCGKVRLKVKRSGCMDSECAVDYKSFDISACGGKDYEAVEGTLTFVAGQTEATIEIAILDDDRYEQAETFRVELSSPSENCKLDTKGQQAMVTILNDDELKEQADKVLQKLGDRDKYELVVAAWKEQFIDAIHPGSEEEGPARPSQWAIHIITVVWKTLFATVPPVNLGGGWPAFFVSLGYIALMTILVGDLAGLFGCVLTCPPAITAITFVALGTSMPDTFASKAAAQADETADNSVGNVTGSNCVNVFLGLGLPWTIGAIYWASISDAAVKAEWATKYKGNKYVADWIEAGNGVAFVVESGDLGLSVIVFCCCAACCLLTLAARRIKYGGELGGPLPARILSAVFFVLLWGIYVLVSALTSTGKIKFSI